MKLFVTGGAGFIGSAVVRTALAQGHAVLNIDKLTYAANLNNLRDVETSSQYLFKQMDITDRSGVESLLRSHNPDAIIHLAAESHVDRSIDGPDDFMRTNVMGTMALLEATRVYLDDKPDETKFRFIHVSTDEVYGDLGPSDPAFTESHPYRPSSPYAASKASSDHLVRAWGRTFGIPYVISNCSNNYGPFQFPEKLIPVTILNALHRRSIPIYGDGSNVRDWLYVEDHAKALLMLAEKGPNGKTYNIGGNSERSNLSLVHSICDILSQTVNDGFDYRALISFVKDRPGHDRRYAINAEKISADLNWSPITEFDEGLAQTVKWYLDNEWWWRPTIQHHDVASRLGQLEAVKS